MDRIRKKGISKGVVTQASAPMSIRVDNDIVAWLATKENRTKYINQLIRKDMEESGFEISEPMKVETDEEKRARYEALPPILKQLATYKELHDNKVIIFHHGCNLMLVGEDADNMRIYGGKFQKVLNTSRLIIYQEQALNFKNALIRDGIGFFETGNGFEED